MEISDRIPGTFATVDARKALVEPVVHEVRLGQKRLDLGVQLCQLSTMDAYFGPSFDAQLLGPLQQMLGAQLGAVVVLVVHVQRPDVAGLVPESHFAGMNCSLFAEPLDSAFLGAGQAPSHMHLRHRAAALVCRPPGGGTLSPRTAWGQREEDRAGADDGKTKQFRPPLVEGTTNRDSSSPLIFWS